MDVDGSIPIPRQIAVVESQIQAHLATLTSLREQLAELQSKLPESQSAPPDPPTPRFPLSLAEYKRYGRQLIMPEIGMPGQLALKNASVLIVGAGGLGCPAAAYLAGAGVGHLGIVDGDVVEESNLQRQIMYGGRVGMMKATALVEAVREYVVVQSCISSHRLMLSRINSSIQATAHPTFLTAEIALPLVSSYSIILDCTDSPASRYLVSDACVLAGKPLVSASALRTDGQLMVLNNPPLPQGEPDGAPCYRCVFPRPPPVDSVLSCAEGGILGPVVGLMGVLQALEAVKIITSWAKRLDGKKSMIDDVKPGMLLFSATSNPPFRNVRLRPTRRPTCVACSASATITDKSLIEGSMDYVQFCGGVPTGPKALPPQLRISAETLAEAIQKHNVTILDVRDQTQFGLCQLDGSVNVPWEAVVAGRDQDDIKDKIRDALVDKSKDVYVVCRLGNDSQEAIRKFKEWGFDEASGWNLQDLIGGLKAWKQNIDGNFPEY